MLETKTMSSVMLDFETFGNTSDGAVVQIGACYFDEKTGEIGETFYMNVDADSSIKSGGTMNGDTVYWWMQQSQEARDSVCKEPRVDCHFAFNQLNNFLTEAKAIWSHATFDFVILTNTLKRLHLKPSFSFRATRDIRTLTALANVKKSDMRGIERKGIHHDAQSDCLYQVKYCVYALNQIRAPRGGEITHA